MPMHPARSLLRFGCFLSKLDGGYRMTLSSRAILRDGLLAAAVIALFPKVVQAAEIKVIAANALKDGYAEPVAAFEKSSGHKVATTWAGTVNATT